MASGAGTFFTVDPLDGTKAFVRRQSHGVGTMVALVEQGRVVSAYVGDINTQEIYGYRPGSRAVHRITEYETSEMMSPRFGGHPNTTEGERGWPREHVERMRQNSDDKC